MVTRTRTAEVVHPGVVDDGSRGQVTTGVPLPPLVTGGGSARLGDQGFRAVALPLLRAEEEPVLGFWIEAGILAQAAAARPPGRGRAVSTADPSELAQIQALGAQALERMTRSNIPLVYFWISRSWTGRDTGGLDVEDLAAVGIDGLIHAIWMWDYRRGLKFSTYASNWIRVHLDRAVIRARGLHRRDGETEQLATLFRTRVTLEVGLGRAATVRELAAALGVTAAAVRDLLLLERNVRYMVRLDAPAASTPDASSTTVGDLLASTDPGPEELALDATLREDLDAVLEQLTSRERAVLTARVGWSGPAQSEDEVAAHYGVTVEQVRRTTQGALARLRSLLAASRTDLEAA